MEFFIFFIMWLVLCGAAAAYASHKGRSGVGIFFLSLFLSPLVGFVVAVVMEPHPQKVAEAKCMKKCPECAETIKLEALVCRFCGHKFQPAEVQAAIQQAKSEFEGKLQVAAEAEPSSQPHVGRPCPKCNSIGTVSVEETVEKIGWNCNDCGHRWQQHLPTATEAWEAMTRKGGLP